MPIEPGQQLLHYRLIEKIGEGGMGAVWKATDTTLDRNIAIKVLLDAVTADPERVTRLEREAKLLGSFAHPNIAVLHGLQQDEGIRFLVMELVEGEALAGGAASLIRPASFLLLNRSSQPLAAGH
jgi:serine/threonine-protein kinase